MKTLFAAALTLLLSASAVAADPYPNKMIRMVVPYNAGGTGDQIG